MDGAAGIDFAAVRTTATGRWPTILPALGVPAETLTGKHSYCAGCEGVDRFRFDDREGRGTWICGGGGNLQAGDGFALLSHVHGWSPIEALRAVAGVLGISGRPATAADRAKAAEAIQRAQRAEYEAALSHELHLLYLVVSNRVASRELTRNRNFREQRPDWRPFPETPWEREELAARRIGVLIEKLYRGAA